MLLVLAVLPGLLGCSSDEPTDPTTIPIGRVSGQVIRDGVPYTGLTVRLTDVHGNTRTTTSTAHGYQFLNVPAGPARVRLTVPPALVLVSPDSAEKSILVPAGSGVTGPLFVLDDPVGLATLQVRVSEAGLGVAGVDVLVTAPPLPSAVGTTDANGDAEFLLDAEQASQATVEITAPAGTRVLDPPGSPQTVLLAADSVSTVTFLLGPIGLPDDTPLNDSPQNTMVRFERTYEYQVYDEYVKLFANNFVFLFSPQSDPDLVTQYGTSWGAKNESDSAIHLFDGFTNQLGEFVPGATRIDMTMMAPTFGDHPAVPVDSVSFYEWVMVPRVMLDIEVSGAPELVVYTIDARHEFYLVRGDVAVLRPGLEARADRWYIYRWDDLSQPLAAPSSRLARWMPARAKTWGSIKAQYLR